MVSAPIGTLERLRTLDNTVQRRIRRVWKSRLTIIQATLAAGLSYMAAQIAVGHPTPFFAPIAAVIILGLSGGERVKRALELTIGCSIGVAIGDLVIYGIGSGSWQIAVVVLVSMIVAMFISRSALVSNQVSIGAILIATLMPPGTSAGTDRAIDAFIGGAVAIVIIAVLPNSPLTEGRAEVSKIMGIAAGVLHDVATALKDGDVAALNEALAAVRGTQGNINAMLAAVKGAKETSTLSPIRWNEKHRVRSMERILGPVDNAIRNVRVLARRAVILGEDHDYVHPDQIAMIDELADIAHSLSELYDKRTGNRTDISEARGISEPVARLRALGARADESMCQGRVLSAAVILAQTRSIIVDLLQVCGMSRESAVAVLVPTSTTPAYPPELHPKG